MLRPTPHQPNILARRDLAQVAHGSQLSKGPGGLFGSQADYAKTPVITTKKDVLNHAFKDLFCVSRPHDSGGI